METEKAALRLWEKWFEEDGDPLVPSECDGGLSCFFCGGYAVTREEQEHSEDCIFIRAKHLIKGDRNGDEQRANSEE